jgi:hypothetical protein
VISRGSVTLAAALLSPSCGNAVHDGEIACQRRLIAVADGTHVPRLPSRGPDLAAGFATMSRGFEQMPLDGCSEEQRGRAAIMARVARDISDMAARIGDPRKQMEAMPSLQGRQAAMEFVAGIEQFERRRQVLREDLDKMVRRSGE